MRGIVSTRQNIEPESHFTYTEVTASASMELLPLCVVRISPIDTVSSLPRIHAIPIPIAVIVSHQLQDLRVVNVGDTITNAGLLPSSQSLKCYRLS